MGKSIGSLAKGAALAPLGIAGLAAKPVMNKLGIGLEDEQGAYNDQADLQGYLRSKDPNVDPITGMDTATKYVQGNALTKGVYGEGGLQSQLSGLQSQLLNEGKNLSDTGFGLSQGDREAYGQVSGDIARMFGQQENQTAQSLNRRGLGGASSGAAGAAFSGLSGNKNEMLARAQTDIAQKRMADTQNRLAQNRQFIAQNSQIQSQLANQGMGLAQNQFDNQLNARRNRINELSMLEGSKSGVLADQKAAVKPGLFSTIGQGLQAGIGNLATQAPGMLVTGGLPVSGGGGGGGGLNSRPASQTTQSAFANRGYA